MNKFHNCNDKTGNIWLFCLKSTSKALFVFDVCGCVKISDPGSVEGSYVKHLPKH